MSFTPICHMLCQQVNSPFMPDHAPIHVVILAQSQNLDNQQP
jgi:hypothetical protein